MKRSAMLVLTELTVVQFLFVSAARGDFINEDVQIVARNATDFQILLAGNRVNQIGTKFISPFNNGAQVAFNKAANVTSITFNAVAGQNFGMGTNHFGFTLAGAPFMEGGVSEDVVGKLISFRGGGTDPVPGLTKRFMIDPAHNGDILVSLENLTSDTLSVSQVGYLVTSTPFPLEDLNRADLPPGAFAFAGIADGTELMPGQSDSFDVAASAGQYITVFADSEFSGASSGEAYKGFVGSWDETAVAPEAASFALELVGLCLLIAAGRSHGRGRRWLGWPFGRLD